MFEYQMFVAQDPGQSGPAVPAGPNLGPPVIPITTQTCDLESTRVNNHSAKLSFMPQHIPTVRIYLGFSMAMCAIARSVPVTKRGRCYPRSFAERSRKRLQGIAPEPSISGRIRS